MKTTEVVFTPAFKPKTEVIKQQRQQIQEEYTIWDACSATYDSLVFAFKIKYFCCVFVFLIIVAVVIFVIACGHNMCPGTGMRRFIKTFTTTILISIKNKRTFEVALNGIKKEITNKVTWIQRLVNITLLVIRKIK
jgi:hypothetical protein